MRAIIAELRADSIKCHALLTSQLRVQLFVQEILQTTLTVASKTRQPSSPSSNSADDITKVCNSQTSQQSQQVPISNLMQPAAEVEKRAAAGFVNSAPLSSSTLQPIPPFKKALISELELAPPLPRQEGEVSSGDSNLGLPVTQQHILSGGMEHEKDVTFAADARSVSSDGPPPTESTFKRLFNFLPSSLTHLNLERHVPRHEPPTSSPGPVTSHAGFQPQAKQQREVQEPSPLGG